MGISLNDIKDDALRRQLRESMSGARITVTPNVVKCEIGASQSATPNESELESKFDRLWRDCAGPVLEREVMLVPGRKWRCDFFHRASGTVIECEGLGKGHQNVPSFLKDAEKYLELTLLGYTVVRLTSELVTEGNLKRVIGMVNS